MKHQDSASFIHSMVKRARKYYLGVTTITQDVEDFLHNDYGKAIVSNASIQFLMKQSSASVPVLAETFYLSDGEKQLLMASDVGEGIFFAGSNHVALRVTASDEEHAVITTNPEEIANRREAEKIKREEMAQAAVSGNTQPPAVSQSITPTSTVLEKIKQNSERMQQENQPTAAQTTSTSTQVAPAQQQIKPQLHGYYSIDQYSSPQK